MKHNIIANAVFKNVRDSNIRDLEHMTDRDSESKTAFLGTSPIPIAEYVFEKTIT